MLPTNLQAATFADVETLVASHAPESVHLDFKEQLPDATHDATKGFVADVCAFANTRGGDLVYGVSADAAGASGAPGIGQVNHDAAVQRLASLVRDRIEPQVHGLEHKVVIAADGRVVLILRVPQSWNGPHRLTPSGAFYARSANGNYQLDIEGVRAAFLANESLTDRLRDFRADRIARIVGGRAPVALTGGIVGVFHIMPFASMSRREPVAPHTLPQSCRDLAPPHHHGSNRLINADGYMHFYAPDGTQAFSYVLLLRNGCIEVVVDLGARDEASLVLLGVFEQGVVEECASYFRGLADLGLRPPYALAPTLCGIKGKRPYVGNRFMIATRLAVPKDDVVPIQEVVVEDTTKAPGTMLRPAFDAMWQIFGLERSLSFDDNNQLRRD